MGGRGVKEGKGAKERVFNERIVVCFIQESGGTESLERRAERRRPDMSTNLGQLKTGSEKTTLRPTMKDSHCFCVSVFNEAGSSLYSRIQFYGNQRLSYRTVRMFPEQ